jgi:hypothetical protein
MFAFHFKFLVMSSLIVAYDGRNNQDESYRCQVSEVIINSFNNRIIGGEYQCELSYNNATRLAVDDRGFNDRTDISSIIVEQVNFFLEQEDKFDNRDYFLTPYIDFVKSRYFLNFADKTNEEKELIKMLFYNINFENYFDEVANNLLRSRINTFFN